ncbi:MAG: hypothetical protein PUE49_03430 [Eggerthellales bacterium]|nr:hypothetical protein [Eggerthellales bacterium]
MEKNKTNKKGEALKYALGGIVLFAASVYVLPKLIAVSSGEINKLVNTYVNSTRDEDDWGPVIEKKESE